MAVDCEQLSKNARVIFEKLQPFFPPDPWKRPCWREEGVVVKNGELDLRKSADRDKLIAWTRRILGVFVETKAGAYQEQHGTLDGFQIEHFGEMIKRDADLLLILNDLDFQIETMDLVED